MSPKCINISGFWVWVTCSLAIFLSSCALNNQIVIESDGGFQNQFLVKGFEFNFPPESDVHFVQLQGAAWVLSGDISKIFREVISEIEEKKGVLLSNVPGSQLNIREITINYTDGRWGGSVAVPGVRLSIVFDGKYDGALVENCNKIEVLSEDQPPVNHGLFATRDEIRVMIQPVFEKVITGALSEAVFLSLVCLSQEAISQARIGMISKCGPAASNQPKARTNFPTSPSLVECPKTNLPK